MPKGIKGFQKGKIMENKNWQCRWSPTLGDLEDTHQNVWGTKDYENDNEPTVFFGLYGIPDFYALWRHKGERHILWAGSDITHFKNGYWLEDGGSIRISPKPLATWINKHCTSWVENRVEYNALKSLGIESKIQPSFLGDVNNFQVNFKNDKVRLYSSVSGDNFQLYGWDKINDLAKKYPEIEFHLYGNTKEWKGDKNVIIHGRVPKEQMNEEIKEMTGAIRMTEFDGCSEIIVKSILMGQYPVSLISYPYVFSPEEIGILKTIEKPNLEGRKHYLRELNNYHWAKKYED